MKTSTSRRFSTMRHRAVCMSGVLGLLTMPSCFREDEELQRQIIEMRAALEAKDKAVEKAQSEVAELQSKAQRSGGAGSAASSEELAKAKQTIEDLKRQIESAKVQAGAGATAGAPFKIDMDAIADKLEEDLTRKAKQLRELVQSQIPGGRIDEIALKSIDYPPQLVTPFSSAITFNVVADDGNRLRLLFPVSADLGGSWKLPSAADVQAAYKAAKDNPQGLAGNAGTGTQAPAGGVAPAQPPAGGGVAPQQPGYGQPGGGGMRQVDANTFAFDWGDGAPRQQQAQPQPQAQQPSGGPAVISNFSPPGGPGSAPAPAPAPAAPNAPAAAPSVPAPVMPVVGDRVIRFDD